METYRTKLYEQNKIVIVKKKPLTEKQIKYLYMKIKEDEEKAYEIAKKNYFSSKS